MDEFVTLHSGAQVGVGCVVDGWWGQYAPARLVRFAADVGWVPPGEFWSQIFRFANAHLNEVGGGPDSELVAQEVAIWYNANHDDAIDQFMLFEWLYWLADHVENWLNSQLPVGPDGDPLFVFEWVDGEFFLSPVEEGEELP